MNLYVVGFVVKRSFFNLMNVWLLLYYVWGSVLYFLIYCFELLIIFKRNVIRNLILMRVVFKDRVLGMILMYVYWLICVKL